MSKYGEGETPAVTEILNSNTEFQAFRNINHSKGYKILMDRTYATDPVHKAQVNIRRHFKINNHLKYDGTAATNHTYGQYWLMLFSDETANFCTYNLDTRLRYVDN
jgi:hypothetical protein